MRIVPDAPLDPLDQGQRDAIYARLADRVTQWLALPVDAGPRRTGLRFELAVTLRARGGYWEHRFPRPQAPDFARPTLDSPIPEMLFRYPGYTVDGVDLFQLRFGSDVPQERRNPGANVRRMFHGPPDALSAASPSTHGPLPARALPGRLSPTRAVVWPTTVWTVNCTHASHPGFRNIRHTPAISLAKSTDWR